MFHTWQIQSRNFPLDLLFLHLQTSMNVLSRTPAVRFASTCPAAISAIVRRATRSTRWPRRARLNQVTSERKPVLTLKSRIWLIMLTCRFLVLSAKQFIIFSSTSSRNCTHPLLHQSTRGEEADGGPQRVHPTDPPAEERGGSGHWHA